MEVFADHTLRIVALGSGVLGATSGALGSFAVLRRQSLLGDALSHAALPGIALAFLVTGSKAPLIVLTGAALAGWLGTLAVRAIVNRSRLPYDSALGLVLSVFFGFGLVLLTYIQKRPNAAQAGLDSFLFGQAAALLQRDVMVMSALAAIVLAVVVAAWKEFKLLSFDPEFGASLGLPMRGVDGLLTLLLVIAVVLGLQTVGVVLMSAMIVAPGAAARQWTRQLGPMVILAGLIGAGSGVAGAVLSGVLPRLPTGPVIVLVLTGIVMVSMLFAPERGVIWRRLVLGRTLRRSHLDPVLMHLYALSLQHAEDPEHGHSEAVLKTMSPRDADLGAVLSELERRNLVRPVGMGLWAPTELGRHTARRVMEREEQRS